MKNSILYLFAGLTFVSGHAIAQSDKPKKSGNEWHAGGDAIPRSKSFADKLKKELNLNEATTKKVFQTYLANTKTVDEIKLGSGGEDQIKESLKANRKEFNEKLKAILTEEQFKKYLLVEK